MNEIGSNEIKVSLVSSGLVECDAWGGIKPQDLANAVKYVLEQPRSCQINEVNLSTVTSGGQCGLSIAQSTKEFLA